MVYDQKVNTDITERNPYVFWDICFLSEVRSLPYITHTDSCCLLVWQIVPVIQEQIVHAYFY